MRLPRSITLAAAWLLFTFFIHISKVVALTRAWSDTPRPPSGEGGYQRSYPSADPVAALTRAWLVTLLPVFLLAALSAEPVAPTSASSFEKEIKPFFKEYCIRCHGPEKQKGKRRFDTLAYPIADDDALIDFQDALDLLNLAEMPPEDEPQPGDKQLASVVAWLTTAIAHYHSERDSTGGETVLRRLNRREYRHTIEDLLHLNLDHFDPTEGFPTDDKIHHLDNQGHALVTSGFLLDQYLEAADLVIEKALPPLQKPETRVWTFDQEFQQGEFTGFITAVEIRERNDEQLDHFRRALRSVASADRPEEIEQLRARAAAQAERMIDIAAGIPTHIRLYEHPRAERHMGSYGYVSGLEQGVPHDGYYLVAVQAEALNRVPPYEVNYAGTRTEEPLTLAFVPGDVRIGPLHLPQPLEPELARFELSDDGVEKYQARIWLNQGTTPRFIYVNGSHHARSAHINAAKMLMEKAGLPPAGTGNDILVYGLQHAQLPQIRIHNVFIRGPHHDTWPTRTQKELLGGPTFTPKQNRANIQQFLTRAYRRPSTPEEVDHILAVITSRIGQGISAYQAYKDGLKAALCSPAFLYLEEPARAGAKDKGTQRLDPYAIASRLSYFLWSSLPDQKLIDLARQGKLTDPKVLEEQFHRMLRDPKSDRFIKGFLNAWLTLDALGSTPPDLNRFKEYYIDDLAPAMKRETHLFTRHILEENLPIDQFLNADYTFANPALARLYGLENVTFEGHGFQKVSTLDKPRSGLLGQASVLTVTANGVDTSPIVRGVWLLENILGTPPNPPPPDVEPLDPDIRGAKTIRDQMEKHRSDPTCAECHRKIDPLGFALENFDPIGRWRNNYRGRGKIDMSGVMPGGTGFGNMVQFRSAMMQERDKFARALTEKLMAYALGRGVEFSDRPEIDAILADLKRDGSGFRYLVKRIILSDAFLQP